MRNIYTLLIFSFLSVFSLSAQNEFVNNGGEVTIENGAELYVHGEVKLNANSKLVNNGFIQMDGSTGNTNGINWISNTSLDSLIGTGKVRFYESGVEATYSISGTGVKFYNLEIDIEFLQGGENRVWVDVDSDVEITNQLELNNGKLITGANEVFVTNDNPTAAVISVNNFGDNFSNYVQGKLKRAVKTNDDYLFPVGSDRFASGNTGYNPVEIENLTTVPGGANAIVAEFIPEPNIGGVSWMGSADCTPHGGIVDQHFDINDMVDNFGYWNLTADNSTGWSYDISTTPSDELLNQNAGATYMKLLKAPGGSAGSAYNWSSDVLNSGILCEGVNVISGALHTFNASSNPTNTPTDVIPATGLTTFSDFGIAKSGTFGLPIELVSLKATPVDNEYIRVDWVTATEINNAGFEVHRSTDGVNFREIGWVDGAGNSTDELEYAFDDHDVEPNKTYYYRLKQIDYDGAFELTYIVNAKITKEGVLTVGNFIPNPSNGNSYINVNSSEVHKIRVQIFTTLGQIINVKDFEINPGLNRMDFDFSMLADGTYHAVIMVDENEVHNKKIVITK